MKVTEQEKAEALERLRDWVKPGDTVYCVLRSVSRSGMSRCIQFFIVEQGSVRRPLSYLGYNIAKAAGYRYDLKREGLIVNGCGMDMGFAVVDHLEHALGYKAGRDTGLRSEWV